MRTYGCCMDHKSRIKVSYALQYSSDANVLDELLGTSS